MASGTQQSAQPPAATDEDEVRECCSLVFDIVEIGIHDLQHGGVVDAEGMATHCVPAKDSTAGFVLVGAAIECGQNITKLQINCIRMDRKDKCTCHE